MEDFGNIVYVLAAIGWFLWKTFGKSDEQKPVAKKRRSNPVPDVGPGEQPRTSTFQDLLDQLGMDEPRTQPVPSNSSTASPTKLGRGNVRSRNKGFLSIDMKRTHLDTDYQMSVSELQGHRIQRQMRVTEEQETESETLIEQLMPNGFDLRQAVVADAVLNRPYH